MRSKENICQHCRRQRTVATLSSNAYTHQTHAFLSDSFISNARLKLAKNQANAKKHPEAELLLFENYSPSSSRHHRKIIRLGY